MRRCSRAAGSFVRSGTTNSCGPPIPAVIVKRMDSKVDWPGRMVVVPTTASGGQHPFRTFTIGASVMLRIPSPAFVSLNCAVTNRP